MPDILWFEEGGTTEEEELANGLGLANGLVFAIGLETRG